MKSKILLYMLAILVSACNLMADSKKASENQQTEIPLAESIIGEWEGDGLLDDGISPVHYKLNFVDSNTLIYSINTSDVEYHNVELSYKFIGETRIKVEGKRAITSEWNIEKDDEYLRINVWGKSKYTLFKRNP